MKLTGTRTEDASVDPETIVEYWEWIDSSLEDPISEEIYPLLDSIKELRLVMASEGANPEKIDETKLDSIEADSSETDSVAEYILGDGEDITAGNPTSIGSLLQLCDGCSVAFLELHITEESVICGLIISGSATSEGNAELSIFESLIVDLCSKVSNLFSSLLEVTDSLLKPTADDEQDIPHRE